MKHRDKRRVEEIVNLWIDYTENMNKIDSIAVEGPTIGGMMADFEGEIPQSSNFKVDGISLKVDRCRKIIITKEQIYANQLIQAIPETLREFITLWPLVRKKTNPKTRSHFTRSEVALKLNCSLEVYVEYRKIACQELIDLDKITSRG